MAVKLPENNRHWTTNWEFRVSDKPPTTNVYAGHGDFSGTTTYSRGIDASKFSGVEKIWVDGGNLSDATATNALTVTNLTDAITFGLKGNVVTDQGAGSPDLITL